MTTGAQYHRKLIEVALPLAEINDASAYDKMPGIGPHPKGIHQWWARLPLPTARAVLFASVVDDPSAHPEKFPTEEAQQRERERLFDIIRRLMQKKLHEHTEIYVLAREEMLKHTGGKLPPVLDPFAGGGSIPLEAARLGFQAHAADLNPVAVLLNKCNLEIVPRWLDQPPVNPEATFLGTRPSLGARASRPHKDWYSRGYLPHFDSPNLVQSLTFRLHDSVPGATIEQWKAELGLLGQESSVRADDPRVVELRERIERFEDAGHGACYLQDPRIAEIVQDALLHFDGERYRLLEWCIMPNHVHVLIETVEGYRLSDVVHSWKSFTAKEANKIRGHGGAFWAPEYYDRFIRDDRHLVAVREYIRLNPVKAGLVKEAKEWQWSSAGSAAILAASSAGGTPAVSGMWRGSRGLAEDVRYYGRVILERARKKIGHLYPKVHIVQEKDGTWRHATEEEVRAGRPRSQEAEVIAWLWARTVASPNPAAKGAHVPLMSTFWLSSKKGKLAWLHPVVDRKNNTWRFEVRTGEPPDRSAVSHGTKLGRGCNFQCILTDQPIPDEHVKNEAVAGKLQAKLLAVVVQNSRGRIYLAASRDQESTALDQHLRRLASGVELPVALDPRNIWCGIYGFDRFDKFFTPRQLTALVTFSDLVKEVRQDVVKDARDAGLAPADAEEYARAVVTFLALALDRCADFNNALCRWTSGNQKVMDLFGKQAIPMVWDFAEANIFGDSVGAWSTCSDYVADCIKVIGAPPRKSGKGRQIDAASDWDIPGSAAILAAKSAGETPAFPGLLVSTDPPYYANIGYAALSDFFYVWLRRTIGDLYPDLFKTILVPKEPELVAAPERFGGDKDKAREHFETGFRRAFTALREKMDPRFPLTVYYAYKQEDEEPGNAGVPPAEEEEECDQDGRGPRNGVDLTTGWETLLEALLGSGFQITATWPVRASQKWRMVAMGTNALASYIVLACRPRPADLPAAPGRAAQAGAPQTSRRDFLAELKKELPAALRHLQQGNIAPVDLAQASIGPGMAVFSRYSKVMEASGRPMTVRTALALINQTLDEVLAEQEAEFDAETLSKAKNTSVGGMVEAGIVSARGGKVRLLRRDELQDDWDPATDARLPVWEMTQHLIRALENGGESGAAELLRKLGSRGETARELCYRLHKIAERRGWAQEAVSYNALAVAWPEIARLASSQKAEDRRQKGLFEERG